MSETRFAEEDIAAMTERLAAFAMENHELCRVWLLQVLASSDPSQDPFWREYCGSLERWAASDLAVPGIDAEVLSVMNLAGIFLWPIWARAHAENDAGRAALAKRFADETLRLSMYGSLRADAYPAIAERLSGRPK